MLRRFLYLNERAVDSYLGVVEGGLSDEVTHRNTSRGGRGGEAGLGFKGATAKVTGQREQGQEEERRVRDTPEQRFDRLLQTIEQSPDEYSYEEVLDLADAFDRVVVGTMITVDCEVEVPEMVRLLSQPEQLNEMAEMMEALRPLAKALGKDVDELPTTEQTEAVRQVSRIFRSDVVIVGEVDDESPRIAGKLEQEYVRELPEGEARVVGKVSRKWGPDDSHSLVALPGASLLTRSQRRKSNVGATAAGTDALQGPALSLDILAIYR